MMVALNKEKMMKKINDNKYGTGFYYTHQEHIFVPRTKYIKHKHSMYYADGSDMYETRQKRYYECVYSPFFPERRIFPSLFNLTDVDMYQRKFIYDLEYVNDELSFTDTSISSLKAAADFASWVMMCHEIQMGLRKMSPSDYLTHLNEKKLQKLHK